MDPPAVAEMAEVTEAAAVHALWFLLEHLRDHVCQDGRHLLLQVWINRKNALLRLRFSLHFSF